MVRVSRDAQTLVSQYQAPVLQKALSSVIQDQHAEVSAFEEPSVEAAQVDEAS